MWCRLPVCRFRMGNVVLAMETEQFQNYLKVLAKAKNDNEKFAALLMVAKITQGSSCDVGIKRQILEAAGAKFFSRLLKTKNVPDGCPENIFKHVALSILSALSQDTDVASSATMTDNVSSFNTIILLNPSETESEDRQLVDDTYQCISNLCQTGLGQDSLVRGKSISSLTEAIVQQMYGYEKAMDILVSLLSSSGPEVWTGCEPALHSIMAHFAKEFKKEMGTKKFELCKTLIFLLTTMPRNIMKTIDPPWADDIVAGLDGILRSKLGSPQREPALKLTAMLIDVCGIQCVIPPAVSDSKLFLLITHLSCVEVRMVLEDTDINTAFHKGRLLSSCYSILETIINHMTSGPSLQLDDRQVMQLHSAMVGAFAAVLHFLRRVANDSTIKWGSVVLATVRVLAAWLSEETSALRNEVYELIPFLVDISKKCVPSFEEVESPNKAPKHSNLPNDSSPADKTSDVIMDSLSETLDKALHIVKDKDKSAKSDNGTKDEGKEERCETKLTNDGNQGLETDENDSCDKRKVTLNDNSIVESHETSSQVSKDGTSNSSEKVCERNTESVTDQLSDRTTIDNDVEKHVSFKVDEDSDLDHVTNQKPCVVSAKNRSGNSNHLDQSGTETQTGSSSPNESGDNNGALHNKDDNLAAIEQRSAKEEKQNGAMNETEEKEDCSNVVNSHSALGKSKEFSIDSYVTDNSVNEESSMSEKELDELHVRVDIFRFLLPGLCHLTAEDLPRLVLIKEGILALLDLYMWRQWNLFLKNPSSREVQSSLVILCNILLNLVIIEPKLVVEREEFCHILLLVVKSVLELELGDCLVVWSHMVTLGLMLLRALSKKSDSFLELETINRFFVSAVRFLSGAYTVEYKKKMAAGITISEGYRQTWDQISQTWFLSMQAFCACVPLYAELATVILKSGWIPALMKSLTQVKGRGVEEETCSCFLLLFTTVANNNKAIRDVVKEKDGEELARMYKCQSLEEALKKQ